MAQADLGVTTIPPRADRSNPLDTIIHTCGRKLCALQMTRLYPGEPTKGEAQDIVRDLLDVARIVDEAMLAIGSEARAHFGHGVDITQFIDPLTSAIEGNATYTICAAVEQRADDWADDVGYRRDRHAA